MQKGQQVVNKELKEFANFMKNSLLRENLYLMK